MVVKSGETKIYRNVCPRNCYSTCSILSHVQNGKLVKVLGDRMHGFTEGKLCAKGYAYTQYVYHPERLKYPLYQEKRGSGNWRRISWEEAFEMIAEKMIHLKEQNGSNLALGYNAFAGNLGFLHYALQGMFQSFGPHTASTGNLCAGTGVAALSYNVPFEYNPPPERMAHSNMIVLWGANPARTNLHQMKFILRARDKGATFVVIDPIFTESARLADIYIQIRPGMDGLLVMGLLKMMLEKNWIQPEQVADRIDGWDDYYERIKNVELVDIVKSSGVPEEAIEELAYYYAHTMPISTWIGFGMQRKGTSIQDVRAIDALVTITGNRFILNGGLYYGQSDYVTLSQPIMDQGNPHQINREIDMNHFAEEALSLQDPPLKLLWIHGKNPLSQDLHLSQWQMLLEQMELVVTTDLYMTHTAKMSNLVLPVTTQFESTNLHLSYWSHYISLNQKAIEPHFEAKSDLDIVRGLVQTLNEKEAHFSSFPVELDEMDWIKRVLTEDMMEKYGLGSWEQLLERPYPLNSQFYQIQRELEKREKPFTFFSEKAVQDGLPALPIPLSKSRNHHHPFQVLTPQALLRTHSQLSGLSWLNPYSKKNVVFINEDWAINENLRNGEQVIIYNENGEVRRNIEWARTVPKNILVTDQGGDHPINLLMDGKAFQSIEKNGSSHFYDLYASIRKAEMAND